MVSRYNPVNKLFNIEYPIIQAGMVWCSGWRLAAAVSNAGGLGLIGSGSMHPEVLREHIVKCKKATDKPFGVNVPLLYPEIDKIMEILFSEKVEIVFTSAGNPRTWTSELKAHDVKVVHVVSSLKFALKSVEAGVDAIVAEGFEAGGHNGAEETTTFCLLPMIREAVDLPVLAAGGIVSGRTMLAAMILGADGVQIGSRFAASEESSAHNDFKDQIVKAREGDTKLSLKKLTPVRLLKNNFFETVKNAELGGADSETLKKILGKGRAKRGMFLGDINEGELEIGQISALIKKIEPAEKIVRDVWEEYILLKNTFCKE